MRKTAKPIPVCYCLHDDHWFLEVSIRACQTLGPVTCFVSRKAWNGSEGCFERVVEVVEAAGAEIVLGDWPDEHLHRSSALAEMKERGHRHILIPDGDEVPEEKLLDALRKIAAEDLADVVRVRMDTYWKDVQHVVRPREELAPILLLNCQISEHQHIREYSGDRVLTLSERYGVLHHLSYAGPDERIARKISTWGHRHEVVQEWYQRCWKGWEADPLATNLHPTHPPAYRFIERIARPVELELVPAWRDEIVELPERWPKVSVVIPLHGGPDDLKQCLDSLAKCEDLLHEVIVVDDASPDTAPEIAEAYPFVTLLANETNSGFAVTCNKGAKHATGSVIFFLNSDTIVPRAGLIRLIECLIESGSVGAVGPMSNNVGYYQRVLPTYTSLETLDLFAEDLALSSREDLDVEMLVGFALAVRKSVLDEVGLFDERFGVGMFEDTDLCYRIARAGYQLRMANRAYVHHWGSRTISRTIEDIGGLLQTNGEQYRAKWRRDIETGFASHLPGFEAPRGVVKFDKARHPDKLDRELARKRKAADISLCMIARNEEKSLGACLESAKPFFNQIIVVDTGSTDRTIEIARENGAEVYEMVWPDSFAGARNESMKYAKGKWVCWLDADDTLPFSSGQAIVEAALSGQADAFIVPVQFLENGVPRGTRVDHVKLFRNLPGLTWTGRIHEQILSQLSARGIRPARLDAVVHHTHYDASPEGQARKLVRDRHLLSLELAENPDHPFTLFNIGMTEEHAGNYDIAIEHLMKALANATPQMTHTRKIYALLAVSLRGAGDYERALSILESGLQHFPADPELHFQAALVLKHLGRFQDAYDHLRAYGEDTSDHYSSIDTGLLTYKRWAVLGELAHELGNHQDTLKWLGVCMEREPWFANAPASMFDACLKVGDLQYARVALDALLKCLGPCRDWAEREARYAERVSGPGNVIPAISALVQRYPNSAEPRLTLCRELVARGQEAVALSHLEELERAGVGEAAFLLSLHYEKCGDLHKARAYARRANERDPNVVANKERLDSLFPAPTPVPSPVLPDAEAKQLLIGPHAGALGKATKKRSVVIVTYQSESWIKLCLNSALPTLGGDDEVIVVDNASADDTCGQIKALSDKRVTLIKNSTNVGYAPAANLGILKSKGEKIVLLNPDTEVHADWLKAMEACLTEHIGAVGPVCDNISGDQYVGNFVPPGSVNGVKELGDLVRRRFKGQVLPTKLIVGMCVMFTRSTLDALGLLDERMILGSDDLDMAWRLRASGLDLVVALDSFVHHGGQASFAKRPREESSSLQQTSDQVLAAKLDAFYGSNLPNSATLWGIPIFDAALSAFANGSKAG